MGAGCLFVDDQNRILLVKPTYKEGWEIPGGVVEENESPLACCVREVAEELGLTRKIGRLLLVDYNPPAPLKTESLMFIFDGGTLRRADIAAIRLPEAELSAFAFFAVEALPQMTASLRQRVVRAFVQRAGENGVYIEN